MPKAILAQLHESKIGMPRFVIQKHEKQGELTHWDLMLEKGDYLKTFRLDKPPEEAQKEDAIAIPIMNHDKRFLCYEGPVNKGLGKVQIADCGDYTTQAESPFEWRLILKGKILWGQFLLEKTREGTWNFSAVV